MKLSFTKMHGLGNDFVVLDQRVTTLDLDRERVRLLADRRRGVGFDQLLVLQTAAGGRSDFSLRVFNADGGEVEQCGNGMRCLGRYIERKGLSRGAEFLIESAGRSVAVRLETDGNVSCDMGPPVLEPAAIPFIAEKRAPSYELELDEGRVKIGAVSMGNPHAVVQVDETALAMVESLGSAIERHARFPNRCNVGFMQVADRERISLRVYERGVGETLACGTGACAAVVAGRVRDLLSERVAVDLPGGRLTVSWAGEGLSVWLTGPATWVFEGSLEA